MLRYATINGAKALRLDGKTGSLTPGKEADIIILDATAINVAPLNQVPGAVVSLMDRTNVETVIVAGKVRKWKGQLLDVDLSRAAHAARGLARLHLLRGGHPAGPVPQQLRRLVIKSDAGWLRPPRVRLRGDVFVAGASTKKSSSDHASISGEASKHRTIRTAASGKTNVCYWPKADMPLTQGKADMG